MTLEHAAHFLVEMGDNIKEIRDIVSQPSEANTENARKLEQLQSAVGEALHILHDKNQPFPNRCFAAITKLEIALEDNIPF